MSRSEIVTSEYISLGAAQEVIGWTQGRIMRAADAGAVRTVPSLGRSGARRYSRADLLRIAGILR